MTDQAIDLVSEFGVISGAPLSFVTAVILGTSIAATIIYFIMKARYEGRVDTQDAHIKLLETQIETLAEEPIAPQPGRPSDERSADYDPTWDKVGAFALWQAAWLWIGKEPHPQIPAGSPAYPAFSMLKQAAVSRKLSTVIPESPHGRVIAVGSHKIDMWTFVLREELVRYAKSIGDHPDFLQDEQ